MKLANARNILTLAILVLFQSNSAQAIINGKIAKQGMFPAAALIRDANDNSVCSGTAIGPHQILTDAHCVISNGAPFVIVGGNIFTVDFGRTAFLDEYSVAAETIVELVGMFSLQKIAIQCPSGYEWSQSTRRCENRALDFAIIEVKETLPTYVSIAKKPPFKNECIQLAGYGLMAVGNPFGGETTPEMDEMNMQSPDLKYGFNEVADIDSNFLTIAGPSIQIREHVMIQNQAAMDAFLAKAKKTQNNEPEITMVAFGDSGSSVLNDNGEIVALVSTVTSSEFSGDKLQIEKMYVDYDIIPNFTASLLRTDTPQFREGLLTLKNKLAKASIAAF